MICDNIFHHWSSSSIRVSVRMSFPSRISIINFLAMPFFWNWQVYNVTYDVAELDEDQILKYKLYFYGIGGVLILSFFISTTLNPILLYYHNSSDKKGVTAFLFSCLAASDFVTNLATPLVYAVFFYSSTRTFGRTVREVHDGIFCSIILCNGMFFSMLDHSPCDN